MTLAAGVVILIPDLVGAKLQVWISGAAYVVIFLSLGLLVKTSGQVSLCHAAFVAVGATTFSRLRVEAGLPWFVALLGAGLVAIPVGAFVALPAIRLSGVYLALATFGFGILMERMVYRTFLMFGSEANRLAPRPDLLIADSGSDRAYFYLMAAFAVVAAVAVRRLQKARLGRLLEAVADSPKALTSLGASVTTALVLVFCGSAFMAGVAGGLLSSGANAAGSGRAGRFPVAAVAGRHRHRRHPRGQLVDRGRPPAGRGAHLPARRLGRMAAGRLRRGCPRRRPVQRTGRLGRPPAPDPGRIRPDRTQPGAGPPPRPRLRHRHGPPFPDA